MRDSYSYDVALSFAGEDRPYVQAVAETLRSLKARVFYDAFEEADLWGKDLYAIDPIFMNIMLTLPLCLYHRIIRVRRGPTKNVKARKHEHFTKIVSIFCQLGSMIL